MQRVFLTANFVALAVVCVHAATNAALSIEQRDGISWLIKPTGEWSVVGPQGSATYAIA